jgi:hypothetical protein
MARQVPKRSVGVNGGKLGPPEKTPPANAQERILALAADGFSVVGIAKDLGVSPKTFNRWLDENDALKDAFDQGREQERYALHNMLYRQAMEKGNATAAMFLLKSRHGYREGDQGDTANRATITINLPGAMPLDKFLAIENEPNAGIKRLPNLPAIAASRG